MKLVPRAVVATSLVLGAAGFLGLTGCRDSGEEEEPEPDGPPTAQENKIQDVQNDAMAEGTKVKLEGVIVTAVDAFGARTGSFYVQEPEGGPFSGVLVFGAKLSDVATLKVGDVINLDGVEKDEFLPQDDATDRTLTELRAVRGGVITIGKVSSGLPPAPTMLDAAAIAAMPQAMAEAEMEKWEGVLVSVANVSQYYDPRSASSSDMTFFDFAIDGGIIVDTSLSAFPATAIGGACYASITGMGDYFYNYKILPRSAADIVLGTGCPPLKSTTINAVQLGTYAKTGAQPNLVVIPDVYVTATTISTGNFKSIWVSSSKTAAAYEGVQVFLGSTPMAATTVVGAKVDITGTVTEYDNSGSTGDKLTEIIRPVVKFKTAPDPLDPLVPLTGISLDTVKSIADGEPYEGVLMTFTGLSVTSQGANDIITLTDTSTPPKTIIMDDDIFDYALTDANVAAETCYSSLTVIVSLNTLNDTRMILPRSAAELDLAIDPTKAACTPPPVPTAVRRATR